MWIRTACKLTFRMAAPVPLVLMLRPRSGAQQWIARESYTMEPFVPVVEYTDGFGNLCQRLTAPAGDFIIATSADVQTADLMDRAPGAPFMDIPNLPETVLTYLNPSRYCESDRLGELAHTVVGDTRLGYDQVAAIERWIRDTFPYTPGTSAVPLSAVEVNQQRQGVCRDLAHLGIALCRSISIPARLVVGYLHKLEPMDLHAWFEAFVGGRWYTFDPTQPALDRGRITIAYGRDAADVAIYHQFGPPAIFTDMAIAVDQLPGPPSP